MQKHLSDCSSHYACLCVTLRGKGVLSKEGWTPEVEY